MPVLRLEKRYSAIFSADLPASSSNMQLILSQEAKHSAAARSFGPLRRNLAIVMCKSPGQ
jgi:hypothetical protein